MVCSSCILLLSNCERLLISLAVPGFFSCFNGGYVANMEFLYIPLLSVQESSHSGNKYNRLVGSDPKAGTGPRGLILSTHQEVGLRSYCSRQWSNETMSDVLPRIAFFPCLGDGGGPQLLPLPLPQPQTCPS